MLVRDATLQDLEMIVQIYNSTIPGRMVTADTEPVTVTDKLTWFHSHNPATRPVWIVYNQAGETLGWVSFGDFYGRPAYNGTAEISIYLHEHARGKGWGKEILAYAISQCPTLGIDCLLGFIFAHNNPSIRLFKNAGFTEWGHLKDIAVMDGVRRSLAILGLSITPA